MFDRAHRLSSSWTYFSDDCDRFKTIFSWLKYPQPPPKETGDIVLVVLPFKDEVFADTIKKQLKDLSLIVQTTIQPVFVSRKLDQELKVQESYRL